MFINKKAPYEQAYKKQDQENLYGTRDIKFLMTERLLLSLLETK